MTGNHVLCDSGILASVAGHVGDGNSHVILLVDPANPVGLEEAGRLNRRVVEHALTVGGTCAGEHGIGSRKVDFLLEETGAEAVAVMRAPKHTLDPHWIRNPDKVFHTE